LKVLEVSKNDLKYNISIIKEMLRTSTVYENSESGEIAEKNPIIIGVVKGNGYGLGLKEISEVLIENQINILAVSSVEEAIELSEMSLNAEVLLLASTSIKDELEMLIDKKITFTIGSFNQLDVLEEILKSKNLEEKIKVHLKIDTGFNRYGFKKSEIKELSERLNPMLEYLSIEGTFSHLSYAYSKSEEYTKKQFKIFNECIETLKNEGIDTGIKHICNSSAFLKYPQMHLDAVRIGSAFIGRVAVKNSTLRKVGKLYGLVSEIKNVEKDEFIGYSNSEKADKNMKIAIVPVGYIDGLNYGKYNDTFKFVDKLRIAKNSMVDIFKDKYLYCKINKEKCKIIGKLGMNHVAIDITGKEINIGDKAYFNVSPLNVNNKVRREYI